MQNCLYLLFHKFIYNIAFFVSIRKSSIKGGDTVSGKKRFAKIFSKRIRKITALTLFGTVSMASVFSTIAFSKNVELTCGEDTFLFATSYTDTNEILNQVELTPKPGDSVSRADSPKSIIIELKRALDYTLVVDGQIRVVRSTEGTVSEIIQKAGVCIGEYDYIDYPLDQILNSNATITVNHQNKIKLKDGNTELYEVLVPCGTVQNAMKSLDVQLSEADKLLNNPDDIVYNDMTIQIDRIQYQENEEILEIPFNIEKKKSDSLAYGKEEIVTKGINGSRKVKFRKTIVNGVEIESKELSSETLTEPITEVRLLGTRKDVSAPCGAKASTNGGTLVDHLGNHVNFRQKFVGSCTAYTAPPGSITATGRPVNFGIVAVDPRKIPYGSKLYICSPDGSYVYGYATAADTGGAMISGEALADLFFHTSSECYRFGRQTMAIHVL